MDSIFDNPRWAEVESKIHEAYGMYWDGCHKIYLAMDLEEVAKMKEYGYDYYTPDFDLLKEWFDKSCWLKFVNAVYTNHDDPNAGFFNLIPQGFFEDEEDDDFWIVDDDEDEDEQEEGY